MGNSSIDDDEVLPTSFRVSAALLAVVIAGAAVIGQHAHVETLRIAATCALCGFGLGIGVALHAVRQGLARFVLVTIAIALSLTTLTGFAMAQLIEWRPQRALDIAAGFAAMSALLPLLPLRQRRPAEYAGRHSAGPAVTYEASIWTARGWTWVSALLAGAGLAVVGVFTPVHAPRSDGLWADAGLLWWIGVGIVAGAIVLAYATKSNPAIAVLALATVIPLSQALAYGDPTVMAAARHIGVVDYIRVHHAAARNLDIYQAWSGLYAGTAWVSDAAHLRDPMRIATWWPLFANPAIVLGVRVVARPFVRTAATAWLAALVFLLTNTLNITYFSPQSLGLLLALTAFAIVIAMNTSMSRLAAAPLLVVVACALAATHQISPLLATASLVALLVLRVASGWWTPIVLVAPAVAWSAFNHRVIKPYLSIGAIGHLFRNVHPPSHALQQLSKPTITRLTFDVPAGVLLIVGLLAVAYAIRARSRRTLALLIAAAAPCALLFVSDYGQEGIFRVVLFALPWLAIAAAIVLARLPRAAVLLLPVALFVCVFGQTALDWARVMTPDDVAATRTFEETAPAHSSLLLVGAGQATPAKVTARYFAVDYVARDVLDSEPAVINYDANADLKSLTDTYLLHAHGPYYALVSTAIGAYDDRYGIQPYRDYVQLEHAFLVSPDWVLVRSGPTASLYEYQGHS